MIKGAENETGGAADHEDGRRATGREKVLDEKKVDSSASSAANPTTSSR